MSRGEEMGEKHREAGGLQAFGSRALHILGGRFGYFIFFSARGSRGKGESEASGGGGGGKFIENPRKGGGGVLQEGEGLRGREGVCGELGNFGGGGANFFSGPKCPPSI